MHLDLPTLVAMESFVTASAGAVLFIAWSQNRKTLALLLWALGEIVGSLGILFLMLGLTLRQPVSSILGGSLLALAPGLVWKAARTFDAKPAPVVLVLLGLAVVGLASSVPGIRHVTESLSFVTGAVYLLAAATTLWLGRRDGLVARWPIIIFMAVHAALLLIGAYSTFDGATGEDALPPVMSLFGIIHFEDIIFALGSAVFILALVRSGMRLPSI
jgi:hypothetical protein